MIPNEARLLHEQSVFRSVVFIANPNAGVRGEQRRLLDLVSKKMQATGYTVKTKFTEGPGHATSLARQVESGLVIAVGGDGTLNEVVNGIHGNGNVIVGCIPFGTVNALAKEIGMMKKSPEDIANSLILKNGDTRGNGEIISIDTGRVQTAEGATSHFILWAGIGFDAQSINGIHKPNHIRERRGAANYTLSTLQTLFTFKGIPITNFSVNGQEIPMKHLLQLLISNTRYYADVPLNPQASIVDGEFEYIALPGRRELEMLRHILTLARRDNMTGRNFMLEAAEAFPWHREAEPQPPTHLLQVSVEQQALKIIKPSDYNAPIFSGSRRGGYKSGD